MAVGKSTVGALVARWAGVPFLDLDVLLTEHGPLADQIRDDEVGFRRREAEALAGVLARPERFVLATGGGAWVAPENRALLRARAATVVLTAPLALLQRRAGAGDRPLWDERVASRYRERQAAYADCDRVVDTAGRTPTSVAREVLEWWSASK